MRDVHEFFRTAYSVLRSLNFPCPSEPPKAPTISEIVELQKALFILKRSHPKRIPSLDGIAYTEEELKYWIKTNQVRLA